MYIVTVELTDSLSDSADLTLLSLHIVSLRVDTHDHWEALIIDRYSCAIYIMIVTCVIILAPVLCLAHNHPVRSHDYFFRFSK